MWTDAHQIGGGTTTEILHDDPQLDTLDETRLVLCDVGAVARAQQGDLSLDVDELFIAVFKINLEGSEGNRNGRRNMRTCLIATVSPVARSMALYTLPKDPPRSNESAWGRRVSGGGEHTAQLLHDLVAVGHVGGVAVG
jgi:hypothetical protein